MNEDLRIVLSRLGQVLGDYALASSDDHPDGARVILVVHDGGERFELADSPTKIVRHVRSFGEVPLWDSAVDTEEDGRWRLFAAHIKEAVEIAGSDVRQHISLFTVQ